MSSPTPPGNINTGPWSELRIGTVVSANANQMIVDVNGTTMDVAFLLPFVAGAVSPPAAGTVVQLGRQDSTWTCMGRLVGQGSNAVLNPSFEESAPGSEPIRWFVADVSGLSVATVVDVADAPDGDFAAIVSSAQSSVHLLYSSPIPVAPGQVWSLSVNVGGEYGGASAETADARLDGLWFANDTNLYPTTSAADTAAATSVDVPQHPPYRSISGSITVPAATNFMRVGLRSTLAAGQALVWDNVIARRV